MLKCKGLFAILNRVARDAFIEKVTFGQRFDGSKEQEKWIYRGRAIQAEETPSAKTLMGDVLVLFKKNERSPN